MPENYDYFRDNCLRKTGKKPLNDFKMVGWF